jgi:steroid C-25 hydroxylase gamma subunit
MKVARSTASAAEVVDPNAAAWDAAARERAELQPVPLQSQPTEYVRTVWANRAYGQAPEATVSALRDDDRVYVRIEWEDDPRPNGEFPDAAGVLFGDGDSLATLGTPASPAVLWHWQEGRSESLDLEARGPGLFQRSGAGGLASRGTLRDGRWAVVLSGALAVARRQVGVAVWNGSNEERAGLAAVSRQWLSLEFD